MVAMDKSADAFRTISEAAEELDVPQHVLRFWETRFPQIKPMKRGGGRRYYRPDDVELLRSIRHLLYGEGYTIRGVQRILNEQGVRAVIGLSAGVAAATGSDASIVRIDGDERTERETDTSATDQHGLQQRREPVFGDPRMEAGEPQDHDSDTDYEPYAPAPQADAVQPQHHIVRAYEGVSLGGAEQAGTARFGAPQAASRASGAQSLSQQDLAQLRTVLADLEDCKRLLARAT